MRALFLRRPPIAQASLWRKQGDINARIIRQLADDRDTIGELASTALRLLDEVTELRDELSEVAAGVPGYANAKRERVLWEARRAAWEERQRVEHAAQDAATAAPKPHLGVVRGDDDA